MHDAWTYLVSLYLVCMSAAVSRAAWIASSSEIECMPSVESARLALTTALTAPTALRSMHGA